MGKYTSLLFVHVRADATICHVETFSYRLFKTFGTSKLACHAVASMTAPAGQIIISGERASLVVHRKCQGGEDENLFDTLVLLPALAPRDC